MLVDILRLVDKALAPRGASLRESEVAMDVLLDTKRYKATLAKPLSQIIYIDSRSKYEQGPCET